MLIGNARLQLGWTLCLVQAAFAQGINSGIVVEWCRNNRESCRKGLRLEPVREPSGGLHQFPAYSAERGWPKRPGHAPRIIALEFRSVCRQEDAYHRRRLGSFYRGYD
jgi:hypothetical protein